MLLHLTSLTSYLPETSNKGLIQRVSIKLRLNRNPVIGDKFASRHGQKGVMSQLWPQENMPFSESGMSPDVIINPHAFPSRMTIAMLVESMASKSGALHGIFQDATPFRFDEKHTAVDYFGQQLLAAGYNYYGNEPMYSGILGCELRADIYIGVTLLFCGAFIQSALRSYTALPGCVLSASAPYGERQVSGALYGSSAPAHAAANQGAPETLLTTSLTVS